MNWIENSLGYDDLCENNTKLIDLNDHCLLLIFEHLDASSLFSITQVHKRFEWIAVAVYRRNFGRKELRITKQKEKPKQYMYDSHDRIEIDEYSVILKLFKKFAHVISKVSIHTNGNRNAMKKHLKTIIEVISDRSECLKCFTTSCHDPQWLFWRMWTSKTYPMENVSKPINDVEHSSIDGDHKELRSKTLVFNEIFPNVRRFYLKDARITNLESISVSFRHLLHLKVNIMDDECIKQLIIMNSKIRFLSIFQISRASPDLSK